MREETLLVLLLLFPVASTVPSTVSTKYFSINESASHSFNPRRLQSMFGNLLCVPNAFKNSGGMNEPFQALVFHFHSTILSPGHLHF